MVSGLNNASKKFSSLVSTKQSGEPRVNALNINDALMQLLLLPRTSLME